MLWDGTAKCEAGKVLGCPRSGTGRHRKTEHSREAVSVPLQHTLRVICAAKPPFRHQTNAVYTPMTALKHADPTGALMTDTFYKMVFKYDTLMHVSLKAIKLIRWQAQKMRQGVKMLGFK